LHAPFPFLSSFSLRVRQLYPKTAYEIQAVTGAEVKSDDGDARRWSFWLLLPVC
jgi:hypothetical protein